MGDVAFWILSIAAVAAGIVVFVVDSMARATYALAASFVAVGIIVLQLHQDYIGMIIILMMVMEMAIMAVYMVMFMGMNPALMPMSMVHDKKAAIVLSGGVFAVLAAGALNVSWPARSARPAADVTVALGESLMGPNMLVMIAISPVMVATIVSGVVLASARTRYDPVPGGKR